MTPITACRMGLPRPLVACLLLVDPAKKPLRRRATRWSVTLPGVIRLPPILADGPPWSAILLDETRSVTVRRASIPWNAIQPVVTPVVARRPSAVV